MTLAPIPNQNYMELFRMESYNASDDGLVERLSDEQFRHMVPVIMYISNLMTCGFVGNTVVFYFYCFNARVTTYTVFITLLSIYDKLVCAFAMPMEISRIVYFYTFDKEVICNYFASVGSMLTVTGGFADGLLRKLPFGLPRKSVC